MKQLRTGVLVAMVLVSALVVVTSPAFATPQITASSGTEDGRRPHDGRAVAPFITPSTNTRSLYTGAATRPVLTVPSLAGATVTCDVSNVSGYATTTHTQFRITSVSFSRNCVTNPPGRVDNDPISCAASSNRPWLLHVRTVDAARRSASGTINFPIGAGAGREVCTVRVTITGIGSFTISILDQQSCRAGPSSAGVIYTWGIRSLDVTCTLLVTVNGGAPTAALFSGIYTIRADTPNDGTLTVTPTSSP
jgi:hypothetical protein